MQVFQSTVTVNGEMHFEDNVADYGGENARLANTGFVEHDSVF